MKITGSLPLVMDIGRMRRGGQGGGSCPPKFGQTVGEIRANSG